MKSDKRVIKENKILDAAERIFSEIGFRNTRMEDIAKEVEISKGSVYFYFTSKENLYMAVTYRAFQFLLNEFGERKETGKNKTGKEAAVELLKYYMDFCENQSSYFDLLMNYLSLVRAERANSKVSAISEAMLNSEFYQKILKIHNLPISMVVEEINRGQKDGSIKNQNPPNLLMLTAWAIVAGFTEIRSTNRVDGRSTIFNVPIEAWKALTLKVMIRELDDGS